MLFRSKPSPYDPRTRPWYKAALEARQPIWTEPYTFASAGELGITHAAPIYNSRGALIGIVGIDFTLSDLSALSEEQARFVSGTTFVANDQGALIGHPLLGEYLKSTATGGNAAPPELTVKALAARLDAPDDLALFQDYQTESPVDSGRCVIGMKLPLSRDSEIGRAHV